MKQDCIPIERFEEILALPPRDPMRLHLDDCPRCRARMTAFRAFLDPEPIPEGARVDDARRVLTAVIAREASRSVRQGQSKGRLGFFDWFTGAAWRPALAMAVLLIAALIGGRIVTDDGGVRQPVLRGGSESSAPAPPAASYLSDGSLHLRWQPMEGAESYRVVFYALDLAQTGSLAIDGGTETIVTPERLGSLEAGGGSGFVRIEALRGGDRIALSPPAVLPPR